MNPHLALMSPALASLAHVARSCRCWTSAEAYGGSRLWQAVRATESYGGSRLWQVVRVAQLRGDVELEVLVVFDGGVAQADRPVGGTPVNGTDDSLR